MFHHHLYIKHTRESKAGIDLTHGARRRQVSVLRRGSRAERENNKGLIISARPSPAAVKIIMENLTPGNTLGRSDALIKKVGLLSKKKK